MFINFKKKKTHLWFYLPLVWGSPPVPLPSILVSRKDRNLVLDVVQCHKPSLVHKGLTNGFVPVLVQDFSVLQNPWDVWWSSVKKKPVTV